MDMNLVAVDCLSFHFYCLSQRDVIDKGSKFFTSGIVMTAWNSSSVLWYANSTVSRQSANAKCSKAFKTQGFLAKFCGTRSLQN